MLRMFEQMKGVRKSVINVLVFPCGSEIGLEVHNALRFCKDVHLVGANSIQSHGEFVYKDYIQDVPFITASDFFKKINKVIDEKSIDYIIPTYDDAILFLAENRDKINCKILTSSKETCEICRSKKMTYEHLSKYDFVPKTYRKNEIKEKDLPIFAKPDIGQGSQGVAKITRLSQLESGTFEEGYIFSELLPGKEYTIDCFTGQNRELVYMSMRERRRIRMGISVNSSTLEIPNEVKRIAEIINEEIAFDGVWFFQVKLSADGKYKLLEMAPRVAGSMSTSRATGFNYILNSLYLAEGYSISKIDKPLQNVIIDRAFISRYQINIDYERVYLDFDDTVTLRGEINPWMMLLIYQWKRDGKQIYLLTRHQKKILESLKEHKIEASIFEEIIEVGETELKSKYVQAKSIFVDDSFRERADVSKNVGIPVFDVDEIESLIDWKF